MKLSISNIAWDSCSNEEMYSLMRDTGYTGLEIAPTKFFPDHPYDHGKEFRMLCDELEERYAITVCSMQSILYGMDQNLFDPEGSQQLLDYLEKAAAFGGEAGGCNLVFGCPRNRIMPEGMTAEDAVPFFEKAAEAAAGHGCVLALEANPPMYGTNFINTTEQAFDFAKLVPGLKVNLDLGTVIDRNDDLKTVKDNISLVNHIHISEPGLVPVQKRELHRELADVFRETDYSGYVSIEMKLTDPDTVRKTVAYVQEIFG